MEHDTAVRVSSAATRADPRLLRHERQLAVSLMSLLPDAFEAAAASAREDVPGVWVVAGDTLYEVEVGEYVAPPANDRATEITCRRRAIDPRQARVSVCERVAARPGAIVRTRRWEFALGDADEVIVIETEQVIRGGFAEDEVAGADEELARALARAAGFAVPAEDVGQNQY